MMSSMPHAAPSSSASISVEELPPFIAESHMFFLVFSFAKLSCKTKLFCEDFCNGQSQYRNADRLRPGIHAGSETGSANADLEEGRIHKDFSGEGPGSRSGWAGRGA